MQMRKLRQKRNSCMYLKGLTGTLSLSQLQPKFLDTKDSWFENVRAESFSKNF